MLVVEDVALRLAVDRPWIAGRATWISPGQTVEAKRSVVPQVRAEAAAALRRRLVPRRLRRTRQDSGSAPRPRPPSSRRPRRGLPGTSGSDSGRRTASAASTANRTAPQRQRPSKSLMRRPREERDPHAEEQERARDIGQEPVHHAVVGDMDKAVQRAQADIGPGGRHETRRRAAIQARARCRARRKAPAPRRDSGSCRRLAFAPACLPGRRQSRATAGRFPRPHLAEAVRIELDPDERRQAHHRRARHPDRVGHARLT